MPTYTTRYFIDVHKCPHCKYPAVAAYTTHDQPFRSPFHPCPQCGQDVIIPSCREWESIPDDEKNRRWIRVIFDGVSSVLWLSVPIAILVYFYCIHEEVGPFGWSTASVAKLCLLTAAFAVPLATAFLLRGVFRLNGEIEASRRRMADPKYRSRYEAIREEPIAAYPIA
jgi:hypothetical protein